jgi:hypothetical protein
VYVDRVQTEGANGAGPVVGGKPDCTRGRSSPLFTGERGGRRGGRLHTSSGRRRGGHVATSAMDSARTGGRHGDVDAVAKRGLGNPCLVSIFVTFFFCRNRLCLTFLHLWKDFDPRSVHWAGPSSLQVQGVIGLPLSHQGYFGPARGKIGSDKRVFLLY